MQTVSDALTHRVIMKNPHNGRTALAGLFNQRHHGGTVNGIQRSRWLIQQQDR
ncbi:hypothetical protein D3C71_1794020 [compost metagenome]